MDEDITDEIPYKLGIRYPIGGIYVHETERGGWGEYYGWDMLPMDGWLASTNDVQQLHVVWVKCGPNCQ